MRVLATIGDVKNFVLEKSPHVRKVSVKEDGDDVIITIRVTILYRMFFSGTFYNYIDPLIQERKLYGLNYKVKITSIWF